MQMVKNMGYPILEYEVVTQDGYRLNLHRIPGGRGENFVDAMQDGGKRNVLIHHGIGASSLQFVYSQNDSIPYQLAKTGKYDVWLTNARGSSHSRKHLWLDPDSDTEYWNFSFEEFAKYDVPAVIEKI